MSDKKSNGTIILMIIGLVAAIFTAVYGLFVNPKSVGAGGKAFINFIRFSAVVGVGIFAFSYIPDRMKENSLEGQSFFGRLKQDFSEEDLIGVWRNEYYSDRDIILRELNFYPDKEVYEVNKNKESSSITKVNAQWSFDEDLKQIRIIYQDDIIEYNVSGFDGIKLFTSNADQPFYKMSDTPKPR